MTRPAISELKVVPFGAQYYRAPTPEPSEWKTDLAAMRDAGFNTIKIWAQWRWASRASGGNQPQKERFYFDDLDALMDLSHEVGLQVVINTILDCAPAWLYTEYPDCVMLNPYGKRVGPWAPPYRQIGGAPGPCFHHPDAMAHLGQFVAEVVKRYARHPALFAWDLWNEPELTVGLMREPKVENLVCYCPHSRREFVAWLEQKYGSLDGLNRSWHRNYSNWDELELPVEPQTFTDMVDWRMFFVETITRNMEERARIARLHDRTHPVMCHTVPPPHFNPITCGSDDWQLARCCDIFGNSVGSDPMPADMLRAAARGKIVVNAEIHAIPGGTFFRPNPISFEETKRHVLVPLAHGIKGFLFWQYRPELLGAESPAWGLTFPDGSPAPWLEGVSRICREITANSAFFLSAEREKPQVAIFTSPANEVFCWSAALSTHVYEASLSGAYSALHRANYSIDFIHPSDVLAGVLDEHRVLYMPLPYWIEAEVLERIRGWVSAGGNLVSECFFAGMDVETGLHARVTPGGGFDQVFGVSEGLVYPESGVFDSYAWQADGKSQGITFRLKADVDQLKHATDVPGYQVGASLSVRGAQVLAEFPTGEAAVTTCHFGSGTATMIGTLLGAAYRIKGSAASADLLAGLVDLVCPAPRPVVTPAGLVRVDVLSGLGGRWIMVHNLSDSTVDASVQLPVPPAAPPLEMFTGEQAAMIGGAMRISLLSRQIKAFWDRG